MSLAVDTNLKQNTPPPPSTKYIDFSTANTSPPEITVFINAGINIPWTH
jgi:hypothetical protein